MSVLSIDSAQFNDSIKDGVSVVDFYADWCGPCRMLGPVLEEISEEIKDVKFFRMNVDDNADIAQQFGINSIPYVGLFKDGSLVDQQVGFVPKPALAAFVQKNL